MNNRETEHGLETITDQGLFECLATAVLREAEPQCHTLAHTGVNVDGKTVKGSLDAITFVPDANPPHMIAVHHTTCKLRSLENKWLFNPPKNKSREGKKSTLPLGDLIKTAQIFAQQKKEMPGLQATLILTTNREPSESLVRKVHAVGDEKGLKIIIWSRSRLAHFLDYEDKGQWIRQRFLNIEQEHLSDKLFQEISRRSLETSHLPPDRELWVDRQFDQTLEEISGRDIVFVVADSGLGKSVACYKRLAAHVEAGGFGLIVPHEIIADALSIEQAICETLRQFNPSLASSAGSEACALASEHTPLLIVVEDINKSGQPAMLIERIASWSSQQHETDQVRNWQILCPVWPRIFAGLGDESRKIVNELALAVSPLTAEEGIAAVQRRREKAGIPITKLKAGAVASALGYDPLLIALQDPVTESGPEHVIQAFVEGSLERLAESGNEYTAGEYRQALRSLATMMFEQRCFDFNMTNVVTWFQDAPDTKTMLRKIIHFGEILHAVGPASDEKITFRHDRIRDWLHADAVADLMCFGTMSEDILAEPYYSEIIGFALATSDVPLATLEQTKNANPLALFCAMRVFGKPQNELHHAILESAKVWIGDEATHQPHHRNLRSAVCHVLSECDAPYVNSFVEDLHEERDDWWGLRARFRNGDVMAGIGLCCKLELGTHALGHLELIDHVKQCRGESFIRELGNLLRSSQLAPNDRSGALRLAGHLGDSELASAIKASWLIDTNREERLADYLWAGAQCCGDIAADLLEPVCDSWSALPDEAQESHSSSPRDDLAADEIRWAFQNRLPEPALHYFIERANTPELCWPITYMLHSIDHPDAVEFIACELAKIEGQLEGTDKFSPLAQTSIHEWKRKQEEAGRAMSETSRKRLRELWMNQQNEKYLRKQALRLWCATTAQGDIPILRAVPVVDDLGDEALFQRLRRGDREAIPRLVEYLQEDQKGYWWQAGRYVWSDELTESLDGALSQRGDQVERTWDLDGAIEIDWILPELLMELPTHVAEELLIKHWDHLHFTPDYVQAALYTATPRLTEIAAQAITECPDQKAMFRFLAMRFGIKTKNRTGITRIEQIKVLSSYFDYIDDHDILSLWETCNDHGWFELRRQHIDSRLEPGKWWRVCVNEAQAMAELDKMLAREGALWADRWAREFLKTGIPLDQMMEIIRDWLSCQTDIRALKMVANIVINVGQRCHLDILSGHTIDMVEQTDSVISNAYFSLKRRSLQ